MKEIDFKLLLAQQVVLLKRIEKLENELHNRSRSAPVSSYQEELEREARDIVNQIRI